MDLQVSHDFGYANYTYAYSYDIIVYSSLFAICIFAIGAFDYLKLKNDIHIETQKNHKIMREFETFKKQILDSISRISDLESDVTSLEEKTSNINKSINSALEQQLDYVNKQFLLQNASIEDVHSKLVYETDNTRAKLSQSLYDIRATISGQMEELEESHSILSNKIDDVHFGLTTKLVEKMQLDKQVAYDMYRYLYFGFTEGSVIEAMQGFFKHFYEFEFEPKMEENIDKILNETHPVRIKRNNLPLQPDLPY